MFTTIKATGVLEAPSTSITSLVLLKKLTKNDDLAPSTDGLTSIDTVATEYYNSKDSKDKEQSALSYTSAKFTDTIHVEVSRAEMPEASSTSVIFTIYSGVELELAVVCQPSHTSVISFKY